MTERTLASAFAAQVKLMERIVTSLDERGYAVVIHRMNPDAANDQFLYRYLIGSMVNFVSDLGVKIGIRQPTLVHIWPDTKRQADPNLFDNPFMFRCNMRKTVPFQPLLAAIELFASVKDGRGSTHTKGTGIFKVTRLSDRLEVEGNDRPALRAFLHILETPHHRQILRRVK